MNEGWQTLVKYRFERALRTKDEAKTLIESTQYQGAVNRIYYAMFYAVMALLATKKLDASKHSGAISLFHREFVKTGEIESEYGKMLDRAFENRSEGDYVDYASFEEEAVREMFEDCKKFLARIEKYLQGLSSPPPRPDWGR